MSESNRARVCPLIADIAGFWPGTVCPLMTHLRHGALCMSGACRAPIRELPSAERVSAISFFRCMCAGG